MTGEVPWALAVSAGLVAALNPCGFALLPAYLSLLVAGEPGGSRWSALARAGIASASMTAGFAGVFVAFGLVLAPLSGVVQQQLPWFTLALGIALVVSGGWLLLGGRLPGLRGAARRGPALRRSVLSMTAFGAAYALASLSCTIGPFLAIVVSAFRAGTPLAGIGLFAAYAGGMGVVVAIASLAVALAQRAVLHGLRRLAPLVSRLGGAVMVVTGAYVAYYGRYEVGVLRGGDPRDGVIAAAVNVQEWFAQGIDRLGVVVLVVALLALVAVAAVRRGNRSTDDDRPTDDADRRADDADRPTDDADRPTDADRPARRIAR